MGEGGRMKLDSWIYMPVYVVQVGFQVSFQV